IPFPRLNLLPTKVGPAHVPLMHLLQTVRRRLVASTAKRDSSGGRPRFDTDLLGRRMRQLQLPWPLRHTIEYLFQNFARCIADPYLFDSVLDLYDVFAALYSWLTVQLPASRQGQEPVFGRTLVSSLN